MRRGGLTAILPFPSPQCLIHHWITGNVNDTINVSSSSKLIPPSTPAVQPGPQRPPHCPPAATSVCSPPKATASSPSSLPNHRNLKGLLTETQPCHQLVSYLPGSSDCALSPRGKCQMAPRCPSLSSRATTGTVLSWTPMYHHVSFSCLSGFPSKISSVTLASSLRPKALPNVGTAESPREPAEWKPGLISPGSKGSYQLSCVPAPEFICSSLYPSMVECDCIGGWGL